MNKINSAQIIGGNPANGRRELDFYPTPAECTISLMEFLATKHPVSEWSVWEPACGDGAMSKILEQYCHNVRSSDIRPSSGYGEPCIDFLTQDPEAHSAVITNPPFNLAAPFIEKAISCAPLVAMLLKSHYWHARKRLDLFNRHTPSWILPMTWRPDFSGAGSATMDCSWVVWQLGNHDTRYVPLIKPII